jgi:hypothetical protein
MTEKFTHDVFLSHSSRDRAEVRDIAERLRADGVRVWFDEWEIRPGDSIPAKIEEGLECSRLLLLCMSATAFGSDWAQLEAGTFRFRDPLNKERRFIPLRLDDMPVKGSLAQFLYVDWREGKREHEYPKLREACRQLAPLKARKAEAVCEKIAEKAIQLDVQEEIWTYVFSPDGKRVLTGGQDSTVRLWDLETGNCLNILQGDADDDVWSIAWSNNQHQALLGTMSGKVRLWDMGKPKSLRSLRGHSGDVWCVAWSADLLRAISGSDDTTIRFWDLETRRSLCVLEGHLERCIGCNIKHR